MSTKVKSIIVKPLLSDEEMNRLEGTYFDSNHYDHIITTDTDVYCEKDGQRRLILRFRKNVISKELTDLALNAYRSHAKIKMANRGAAAGIIDTSTRAGRMKLPKYVRESELVKTTKFRTSYIDKTGKPSKLSVGNQASSNIAGYFDNTSRNATGSRAELERRGQQRSSDRTTGSTVPCRLTSFSRKHSDLWMSSLPFLIKCDRLFHKLIPEKHYYQWLRANATREFNIAETAFSTITLNYSWRTALHKDQGDYKKGFGNLIVIEDHRNPNKYNGCYTGFPQFGVAVDCRTGDFLAMDVHEWHCNTEFINGSPDLDSQRQFNRLSVVCYLRNNMIHCRENPVTQEDFSQLQQRYYDLYS